MLMTREIKMEGKTTFNVNLQDGVIAKCPALEPVHLSGFPSRSLISTGDLGKSHNFMYLVLSLGCCED